MKRLTTLPPKGYQSFPREETAVPGQVTLHVQPPRVTGVGNAPVGAGALPALTLRGRVVAGAGQIRHSQDARKHRVLAELADKSRAELRIARAGHSHDAHALAKTAIEACYKLSQSPVNTPDERLKLLEECMDMRDRSMAGGVGFQALINKITEEAIGHYTVLSEKPGLPIPEATLNRLKALQVLWVGQYRGRGPNDLRSVLTESELIQYQKGGKLQDGHLKGGRETALDLQQAVELQMRAIEVARDDPTHAPLQIMAEFCAGESLNTLHACAKAGDRRSLETLLNSPGADINEVDGEGYTPLMWAVQSGRLESLQFLLANGALLRAEGARVGHESCLNLAVCGGHLDVARFLIERGDDTGWSRADGITPLMAAAQSGNPPMVELLLEKGAPAHAKDKNGFSALHYAAEGKHESIVGQLLKTATIEDINSCGRDGHTPLLLAAAAGCQPIVELLQSRGADPLQELADGTTCLMLAAKTGNKVLAMHMLQIAPGQINQKRQDGKTPLMQAARYGHLDLMESLQRAGGDANLKDNDGNTALNYCRSAAHSGGRDAGRKEHAKPTRPLIH